MRTRLTTLLATLTLAFAVVLAGCGDDSDAADDPADAETGGAETDAASGDADDADDDGSDPAPTTDDAGATTDDLIGTVLTNIFGLGPEVLTDDERACMNSELEPVFGDVAPTELTEEVSDAIDAAATSCGAEIGLG